MATDAEKLRDAIEIIEGLLYQHCGWSDGQTHWGLSHDFLSANEAAFEFLGWEDPHPVPEMRCDEPGCNAQITIGWPTRKGGTGLNGGYRRTCVDHWRQYNR